MKYPNQAIEGEFSWVVTFTTGYSHRRNDVTHGVMAMIHMATDPKQSFLSGYGPPQWALVPPHFREAKFVSPNTPAHILTSREINAFTEGFWRIIRRSQLLSHAVELPQHALRRKHALPPPKDH